MTIARGGVAALLILLAGCRDPAERLAQLTAQPGAAPAATTTLDIAPGACRKAKCDLGTGVCRDAGPCTPAEAAQAERPLDPETQAQIDAMAKRIADQVLREQCVQALHNGADMAMRDACHVLGVDAS